ncbi:MAG TPA: hypothetical protein VHX44_00590, partial [Planctomycetota bacterium]|nr:hypothetical protein [Planctomycetota bacterium]
LIAALSALNSEAYQPEVELLVAGINSTHVSLSLVNASPSSCRQAVAFALDTWWAMGLDGTIVLQTSATPPRGALSARTLTSTLRRQPALEPLAEHLLAPWLGGQAGLSYLPNEGQWSASLDEDGHRRLVEFLSLCERPASQAASRVSDADTPDQRRLLGAEISVRSWPALVTELAQATQASISLSPRLRLRPFPADGVKLPRMAIAQLDTALRQNGIAARWCRGVLCLGENHVPPARVIKEHPAQRRRLALIPIGHLLTNVVDGDLIVTALRRHVAQGWWDLPGAGIEYLANTNALLVAGDVDSQQAVLDALAAIDTLGLELGLRTITGNDSIGNDSTGGR